MIQHILVAIGDKPHEMNALDYAGHLAVLLNVRHISCVHFQERGYGDRGESIANRVLEKVKAEYDQYDFLNYHVDVAYGKPSEMLCQKAHSADLVVIGLPESIKTEGLKQLYSQIDDVLLNISRPTIVVHEQCTLLRKILTVQRGDGCCDRVLELAVEFGERANAKLLGLVLAETRPRANEIVRQMKDYLRFHDVSAEFTTLLGFTVVNILETAAAENCDLIALHPSHHGRLYELIFQSTTEAVAKMAERAVLVAR